MIAWLWLVVGIYSSINVTKGRWGQKFGVRIMGE